MSRHRVDLPELADVVDRLARFEQVVEAALDDADRHVNRLHAEWTGAAAQEHRAVHLRWRRGVEEMREALAVMRRIGDGAHANYSAAVSANTGMWQL